MPYTHAQNLSKDVWSGKKIPSKSFGMSDDAEMPSVKKQRGSSQNGNVEGALNESIRDYSVPLEGADLFVEDAEGGPPSPNPDIIPQSGGTFPLDNRESMDADNRPVCRYFLLGVCAYGDDCRFSHQIPPRKPGSDDYSNTQHLKTVAAGSNSRGAESKPSIQSDTHSSKTVCRYVTMNCIEPV